MSTHPLAAKMCYLAAVMLFSGGMLIAAHNYPGGFDWAYMVVSALASKKTNPQGSQWFSLALVVSMLLLWPCVTEVRARMALPPQGGQRSILLLRVAVIGGALVGMERLLVYDISAWVNKSHELVALVTLVSFYAGIIGLLLSRVNRSRFYYLPLIAVAAPLVLLGVVEFYLYLEQRAIGWVGVAWRDTGLPFWLSFAFWQWMLVGFFWLGIGVLVFDAGEGPSQERRARGD